MLSITNKDMISTQIEFDIGLEVDRLFDYYTRKFDKAKSR